MKQDTKGLTGKEILKELEECEDNVPSYCGLITGLSERIKHFIDNDVPDLNNRLIEIADTLIMAEARLFAAYQKEKINYTIASQLIKTDSQ